MVRSATDVLARQQFLSPLIRGRLERHKGFRRAVRVLRKVAPRGCASACDAPPSRERPQFLVQTVEEGLHPRLVRAEVDQIDEHLKEARGAEHPEERWAEARELPQSLRRAIRASSRWGDAASAERSWRRRLVKRVSTVLWPLTHALRAEFSPPEVSAAASVCTPHAALFAAVAEAFGLDPTLVNMLLLGAQSVGEVQPSGVWLPCEVEASLRFDELDHAHWNEWLLNSITERGLAASGEAASDAEAVWKKTLSEEDKGFIRRVSRADLDARYGHGNWRAIRRFGIWQGGKIRCCENCTESGHNAASSFKEKLWCETADLPARIAAAFAGELGESEAFGMQMGTDDMEAAYRRVLVAAPQHSIVAVWDTEAQEVALFSMPGFNFGLHSAVLQYNRVSHFIAEAVRRIGAVAAGNYYDDFVVCEPSWARGSGQSFLTFAMAELGYPASEEKHVPMASSAVFLGVRADFSEFERTRAVLLSADTMAVKDAGSVVQTALRTGHMTSAVAGKLAGQLAFMTGWAAHRVGRAALQPLYRRAQESLVSALTPALEQALGFFGALLASAEGLPKRRVSCRAAARPTVLVWSDASAEESAEELGRLGFVVLFPAERVGGVDVPERWVHATAAVPPELTACFRARKQYIGLYEQVAAVAVYQTLGAELTGRRVVHFIDNQGAMAGLAKGYAREVDSARVVHAFHAWNAGARVSVWFEYVRSKANIADLPSRNEFAVLREMGSELVEMQLPEVGSWDAGAAAWMEGGREVAASRGRGQRGRRRPREDRKRARGEARP